MNQQNNKENSDTFQLKSGENVSMNSDEIARWSCLIEAVDIISEKGAQMKMDMTKNNWVKPIAIQKYIDDRLDTMIEEINRDKDSYRVNF